MDFIREELLRQKRLLTVLMTGKTREQTEEYEHAGEDFSEQLVQAGQGAGRPVFEDAASDNHTYWMRTFMSEQSGSAKTKQGRRRYVSSEEKCWRQTHAAEENAGAVYVMPHKEAATGRSDVREMSRTIQRDARRYDGGFLMY